MTLLRDSFFSRAIVGCRRLVNNNPFDFTSLASFSSTAKETASEIISPHSLLGSGETALGKLRLADTSFVKSTAARMVNNSHAAVDNQIGGGLFRWSPSRVIGVDDALLVGCGINHACVVDAIVLDQLPAALVASLLAIDPTLVGEKFLIRKFVLTTATKLTSFCMNSAGVWSKGTYQSLVRREDGEVVDVAPVQLHGVQPFGNFPPALNVKQFINPTPVVTTGKTFDAIKLIENHAEYVGQPGLSESIAHFKGGERPKAHSIGTLKGSDGVIKPVCIAHQGPDRPFQPVDFYDLPINDLVPT